ncbi:hypothetical protein COCSUDRAFT_60106 [Coccomyxa subellipsoidea C-169]|uniref:Uncharacterized protein n=1 Tax=Coccomyxa subellipsoidea (strain C-169) TaxID=574566 RepID=I0YJ70_COCSC|nr:hypothetical protein COCSUDRAFT_60106 [Coccomyxa subellipsoidea C-169]EIE18439.1 hypothetical protein COCSUDRAFT_60106 [Coccomyxa subellipsoidea C-169]|eukprot:XP_005642983.1 hypothetical protein COCSUDRAFT_60106 [Coccomyxa subellipsoidea C-169]
MAVSNEDASLPDLDDLLDPDIARILDEADLMEASDDEDEGTERGVGSEVEYSKDSDSGSEYSTAQSDADSEATEDVEVVGEERAASDAYNTALSSLSPLQGADMQPSAMPSTTDTAGASPGRPQMPAALLPASPEDEPIGCRTRTRLPMQHISLDELDALLGEEGDELFDEEGEQYQQFLRVLRGEADPLELYDGEDDDEDFVLDWDELMGANFGKPTAAGASEPTAAPRRSTRIRTYVYAPKHTRPGHQERPVQSTLLLQTRADYARLLLRRQLKQLLPAASRQLPLAPAAPRPPPLPPGQAAVAMALGRPAPSQGPPPVAVAGGPQPSWKLEQVAQLHRQVAQHVQLLVTSFAAATQLPGRDSLVASAGHLIHSLQGLPASMRAWPVVMSVVRALSEAATVEAALEAMAQLPACFTASLLPDASAAVLGREWLPGEDELLARGLLRFGQEPGRLRQYFLPGRAAEEIPPRIRNRCTLRAGDNPVKAAIARLRGPLTAQEIAQIEAGLLYYGRQA